MKPYFSIVIPTLNEEKFVGRLLSDLSKQSFLNFEVFVVDSNSEDNTVGEVKKYKSQIKLLKIMSLNERHVSKQRNKGAAKAKGEYLVFLDADSRIHKNFLTKLFRFINRSKGLLFLPKLSISAHTDPQMEIALDFSNAFVAISNKMGRPFSTGGSMILEKHFFHHIGGFPEEVRISEDHLLVKNAYKHGVSAKLLPSICVQMSLRRFSREGKLTIFLKYIKSTLYFFAKGKVDKKVIEYEMGGHLYNKKAKKVFLDLLKIKPQLLLRGFNKNIRGFIQDLDI